MPYARNAVDAARVYFEDDGGPGAPVLILGGFLDPVRLVRRAPLAVALGEHPDRFRSIFIDHRGHGSSEAPHDPDAYTMPLRVADVVGVLDHLGIGRAHVVGLSWGGRLAFGLGEHAPDRVRSLVTIGQHPYALDPDGPLTRSVIEALDRSSDRGIEALIEAFEAIVGPYPPDVRAAYLAADAAAMRAAVDAAVREGPVSDRLSEWRVPCLVCVAAEDVDFFEPARRASEEIPDARFVSIEASDHLGMDTARVDPFWPAILQTLEDAG